MMQCDICGKALLEGEAIFCRQCREFLEWKYDSLENYEKIRNKEVKK